MNEPFELLVKRMRDAQKRFFKVRGTDALELSRKLEKEVDARIEEMTVGGDLFGGTDTTPCRVNSGSDDDEPDEK